MKLKLVWNDYKRNRSTSIIMIAFIAVASILLSLTSILSINLIGSIDKLMEASKTPHFMQMHSGDINKEEIYEFALSNKNVEEYQVIDFLGIENDDIIINGVPFTETIQDSGFVTQSTSFDYLLNLNGNLVFPAEGELYVPIFYSNKNNMKIGDTVEIDGVKLKITGFIRDSQMSSALASSKRFLVNKADYNRLIPKGSVESLIEFRLKDLNNLGSFSTEYSNANLPGNGPTLTWPLFRMVNAMSDGVMIAVILLMSLLVVIISLLCIRFTLLSKIEEDFREIGTLKAIGVRLADIRSIYLYNYGVLALIGIGIGFLLSAILYRPLLNGIILNFGESGNRSLAFLIAIIAVILLFIIILLFVLSILKRFKKMSVTQALRTGYEDSDSKGRTQKLTKSMSLPINYSLGIKDVISKPGLYLTLFLVIILASFIILIPQNLYNTMSSNTFISYMGIGNAELRIDISQSEDIKSKTESIIEYVLSDEEVEKYSLLETKTFSIIQDNGTKENVKIELGDFKVFPINPIRGIMPENENEIAISSLLANEWEKDVGETITLVRENDEKELIISGVYSDITNGGKTAKAIFKDENTKTSWNIIYINFKDGSDLNNKFMEYDNSFKNARVSGIENYITQVFGPTLQSINRATVISLFVALVIIFLITVLFLKLLIVKNKYNIAVTKALGFTNLDLKKQFGIRIIVVMIFGVIIGTILTQTLGESIVAGVLSSFGAEGFKFQTNITKTFIIFPVLLFIVSLTAVYFSTRKIGNINIPTLIKE